ncbi:hypothetical protein F0562_012366 [Nyssa sinensis]|uniref:Uncharacterized protein n=1 Tax=Nyssa sinensis TaxID=561372 RepID=A0A5J4ZUT3_9ASTE|nr:hypothetical protein F0562_012366 [Nyssa sinensis]
MDQTQLQSPLTRNDDHVLRSFSHHSTINGFQAHAYGILGAHSSDSTFNIKNEIHFTGGIHNAIDESTQISDVHQQVNDGVHFRHPVNGIQLHSFEAMGVGCRRSTFKIEKPTQVLSNIRGMDPQQDTNIPRWLHSVILVINTLKQLISEWWTTT